MTEERRQMSTIIYDLVTLWIQDAFTFYAAMHLMYTISTCINYWKYKFFLLSIAFIMFYFICSSSYLFIRTMIHLSREFEFDEFDLINVLFLDENSEKKTVFIEYINYSFFKLLSNLCMDRLIFIIIHNINAELIQAAICGIYIMFKIFYMSTISNNKYEK